MTEDRIMDINAHTSPDECKAILLDAAKRILPWHNWGIRHVSTPKWAVNGEFMVSVATDGSSVTNSFRMTVTPMTVGGTNVFIDFTIGEDLSYGRWESKESTGTLRDAVIAALEARQRLINDALADAEELVKTRKERARRQAALLNKFKE